MRKILILILLLIGFSQTNYSQDDKEEPKDVRYIIAIKTSFISHNIGLDVEHQTSLPYFRGGLTLIPNYENYDSALELNGSLGINLHSKNLNWRYYSGAYVGFIPKLDDKFVGPEIGIDHFVNNSTFIGLKGHYVYSTIEEMNFQFFIRLGFTL